MSKQHISFTDIVDELANPNSGWGRKWESMEDASKELIDDGPKLTAYCLLSFLKRIERLSGKGQPVQKSLIIPCNAKPFPNKKVGDRLFFCDYITEGYSEHIIISKNEDDLCLVIPIGKYSFEFPYQVEVANDEYYESLSQAVIEGAKKDYNYHRPRAEFAQSALVAAEAEEDLSEFANGME